MGVQRYGICFSVLKSNLEVKQCTIQLENNSKYMCQVVLWRNLLEC